MTPARLAPLVALLLACGSAPSDPTPPPPPPVSSDALRIVMLGNSLTYTHDVPGLIADLATSTGAPRPVITTFAYANFALEDHFSFPASIAAIDAGGYDVVVMQQGPSTLPSSGANLLQWSGVLADRIVAHGGRAGMYVVWPPFGDNIDNGISNYVAAADAKQMAIYPVGQAFRSLLVDHPEIQIREADGFHPNPAGAWLAAIIIAGVIYDVDPVTFPNLLPRSIPDEAAATLRTAAHEAIRLFGRR